jgi:single-strand DNA-binding protein
MQSANLKYSQRNSIGNMVNKVIIIGNVGADPEVRVLDGGNKVASLSVATTERYTDRQTNTPKEITEWHHVVAWRNTADIVDRYVKKGSQLYVEGRLRTRDYTDRDGVKRYITEIMADTVRMLGKVLDRKENQSSGPATASEFEPDDLPF